jgi:CRISPR-associated autoregulator DevR family
VIGMVFVSFGFRFRVNVEAMNMVESVGNYSRHRVAPIIRRFIEDDKVRYEVQFLPVVSGQSVANAYMRALTDLAVSRNIPVCDMCRSYMELGGFPKRPNELKDVAVRIQECAVEDITGFMAAPPGGGQAVRRTSRVQFSYLIPDADSARHVSPMPQFHVRYGKEEQMIFNVESGSAIYTLITNIDVDGIGRVDSNKIVVNNRRDRITLAIEALALMINGGYVGAKKSRYFPQMEPLGAVAVVSHPYPLVVSPPKVRQDSNGTLAPWYLEDTVARALRFRQMFNATVKIFYLGNEFNWVPQSDEAKKIIERVNDINSLIDKVKNEVLGQTKDGTA